MWETSDEALTAMTHEWLHDLPPWKYPYRCFAGIGAYLVSLVFNSMQTVFSLAHVEDSLF